MTVIPLSPREALAEKLERSRKLAKVHFVTPAQDQRDRETWAQRKMDDALTIYREMFGTAALHARLQRAIEEQPK
jgi:hypothetical protein